MSTDPITKLLDIFYDVRDETGRVIDQTLGAVSDSRVLKQLETLVFGDNPGTLVGFSARPPPTPPLSLIQRAGNWVCRNKLLTTALVFAATGASAYGYVRLVESGTLVKTRKKRRAKRAGNGARKQVVIIAGSPAEPMTRIVANDLEKRGFIVYWTTASAEEEALVAREKSADIRPLRIKPTESASIQSSVNALDASLRSPVAAFPGAVPHYLELTGIIVVPDLFFPSGPVESLRVDTWTDLFYAKVLGPITLLSNGLLELARNHSSRIILMTPTIMGDINAGFHAPECIIANALSSMALCLHRELRSQEVPFLHLKLGSFDVSRGRSQHRQIASAIRADILSWPDNVRSIYAQPYQSSAYLRVNASSGSNLRVLYHTLYDALTTDNPKRIWYAGRGAYFYNFLSNHMPEWLMTVLLQPPGSAPQPPLADKDWERL